MEKNIRSRNGVALVLILAVIAFFLPYIQFADWGWEIERISFSLKDIAVVADTARFISQIGVDFIESLPYLLGLIMILPLIAAILLLVGKDKSHYWLGIVAGTLMLISHSVGLGYKIHYSELFELASASLGYGFYINLCLGAIALIWSIVELRRSPSVSRGGKLYRQGLLIGRTGMYANATIDIPSDEEIIIGRDSALAHVVLDSNSDKVSRKHCSISYDGESRRYSVTDYSTNGTFVEGGNRLVANIATTLSPGTVILLGNKDNSFTLK